MVVCFEWIRLMQTSCVGSILQTMCLTGEVEILFFVVLV